MEKKKWKSWELDLIKRDYPTIDNKILIEKLGVTLIQLRSKAYDLGVRKASRAPSNKKKEVSKKKDTHAKKLEFGKSLDPNTNHFRLGSLYDKYGFYQFEEMYKQHSV